MTITLILMLDPVTVAAVITLIAALVPVIDKRVTASQRKD